MAVLDRTQAELDELGALDTVEGQSALRLAEQLDGRHNSLATAQTVKTLIELMDRIRDSSAAAKVDSVDDSRDETERILRSVG